jgi:hypothetical protein
MLDVVIDEHLNLNRTAGMPELRIVNSKINTGYLDNEQLKGLYIRNSKINKLSMKNLKVESGVHLVNNQFGIIEIAGSQLPATNTYITFDQVSGKLFFYPITLDNRRGNDYVISDTMDFEAHEEYDMLVSSYKLLLNSYQNRGDQTSYNACYVEMKNLETRRLEFIHHKNPSFKSYFTWKINQFLKVFSAYGTEPARAIIFSLYVILFFAVIYLFFPNSWDSHGKKRIMNRFRFFTKYMKRDAGIHEVYLEEKKEDLLDYEDFKNYMEASGKSIPKFFLVTALPLYKWAISGTKLTSAFLKRVDVMKGTWEDVPDGKRWWKGILLIGAFSIAIIYDIMIKMLNALMLSINTFTTLGFGEIPIKGLPRYLAIIEGFIGWFMLTIFSVSLISQLLN